ncbi:hypothetical protein D9M68_796940 [compost metagenome]
MTDYIYTTVIGNQYTAGIACIPVITAGYISVCSDRADVIVTHRKIVLQYIYFRMGDAYGYSIRKAAEAAGGPYGIPAGLRDGLHAVGITIIPQICVNSGIGYIQLQRLVFT